MRAFWDYKDARYILNSERPLATGVVEETWLNYTNGPTCFDGICKVFDSGVGIKLNATGSRIYKGKVQVHGCKNDFSNPRK